MNKLDNYKVDLKAVTGEGVSLHWQLDDDFFSAVQGPEIQQGSVEVTLRVKRSSQETFSVEYQMEGVVNVQCDRCLEWMEQPVQANGELRVRLGEGDEDDGEVITVDGAKEVLSLAWPMYEAVALAIPMRHVHPEGECPEEVAEVFAQTQEEESQKVDSRWAALEALKGKINNN